MKLCIICDKPALVTGPKSKIVLCGRCYRKDLYLRRKKKDKIDVYNKTPKEVKVDIINFVNRIVEDRYMVDLNDINDIITYYNRISGDSTEFNTINKTGLHIQKMYHRLVEFINLEEKIK